MVSIRVNGKATNARITVADLTGRKLLSGTAVTDGTFSLHNLPAGRYIITVQDGAASTSHKVLKY